jgi:signal transduction histidine kinase/FixJ family two-component response regulator/HPt (histidine-containing phosphotransfer) domain-containing protein
MISTGQDGQEAVEIGIGHLCRRLHARLMPDYNRRATTYWWVMVALGVIILAYTLRGLAAMRVGELGQVAIGIAIAMVAGFFPVRIPRSSNSFAAGEIFIFLLLLLQGPEAATLAAAGEGLIGAWRTSKRWTSRIVSPAMAAVAMSCTGAVLSSSMRAIHSRGLDNAGLLLIVTMVCAILYFVLNTILIAAVPYLKRSVWPSWRELFGNFGWIGTVYAGSASVSCLLFVSYQQAGIGVLIAAAPIIAMLLSTLHYYFRQKEVIDRTAQMSLDKDVAIAANLAKTRFLANMSHELRTPLNAVIGAAQLLRIERSDPERQEYLIEAIQRGGSNLLSLIENTLDLARIEAGEMTLHLSDFHIVECIEAALSTAALTANAKGLRLNCVIDPALPAWRHGEAERLRQVLLNLLGNAVKFTEQGEIVVRVQPGAASDCVRISVSDTGVGIRAASLAHIFEPFRQADDGADRRFGGSGLGLAIVRELVQVMGGHIAVTSAAGEGSRFEFELSLPLAEQPPAEVESMPHRVVFLEPHEVSAQALQAQLQRLGWNVQRATDAAQLREALLGWADGPRPWVLLATEARDSIELLEPVADLVEPGRVIGMAYVSSHEAEKLREHAGLSRHLIKPITRAALVSCMARTADLSEAAAALPMRPVAVDQHSDRKHVLLVEDDPVNRSIACSMLEHAGYRVSVAHDGEQALQLLPQLERVDLVLMDWQMPGLDGLEVTRRMRAGAAGAVGRNVPIVALTANAFVEDRAACLCAGMNDFMTKPVLNANLRSMAARWTGQVTRTAAADASDPMQADPEAAAQVEEAPIFDASVLAALPMVADGSDPEYARMLLGMFLKVTAQTLRDIERAASAVDVVTLQRLVHTLKSSSASVGALKLAALASAHETRLRRGHGPAKGMTQQLTQAIQRLTREVQPYAVDSDE